jgi:hypothetical protein
MIAEADTIYREVPWAVSPTSHSKADDLEKAAGLQSEPACALVEKIFARRRRRQTLQRLVL